MLSRTGIKMLMPTTMVEKASSVCPALSRGSGGAAVRPLTPGGRAFATRTATMSERVSSVPINQQWDPSKGLQHRGTGYRTTSTSPQYIHADTPPDRYRIYRYSNGHTRHELDTKASSKCRIADPNCLIRQSTHSWDLRSCMVVYLVCEGWRLVLCSRVPAGKE